MADREVWMTVPFLWDIAHMARDHIGHARCDSEDGCVVRVPGALLIEDREKVRGGIDTILFDLRNEAYDLGSYPEMPPPDIDPFGDRIMAVLAAALNEGEETP